jgi:DNA-binding SARP family transcriptional activator
VDVLLRPPRAAPLDGSTVAPILAHYRCAPAAPLLREGYADQDFDSQVMGGVVTGLRFGVLGPLLVHPPDKVVRIGALKQRTVLASLLLRVNEVVSTDHLVGCVWGDKPPATASRTLQSLICRLRQLIQCSPDTGAVIDRCPPGYILQVAPEHVDCFRFEQLAADARRFTTQGCPSAAATRLREALDLWRGPALADCARTPLIQSEALRLEEQRHAAVGDRIDAELALGHHHGLLGELQALTNQYPLRERHWEQLILAHFRSGRQADALAAFQLIRSLLATELGVEPGPRLQDLHRRILVGDLTLWEVDLIPAMRREGFAPA